VVLTFEVSAHYGTTLWDYKWWFKRAKVVMEWECKWVGDYTVHNEHAVDDFVGVVESLTHLMEKWDLNNIHCPPSIFAILEVSIIETELSHLIVHLEWSHSHQCVCYGSNCSKFFFDRPLANTSDKPLQVNPATVHIITNSAKTLEKSIVHSFCFTFKPNEVYYSWY
jgi:hypothetical protein